MSLLTTSEASNITSLSSLASGSSLVHGTRWSSAFFDFMSYPSTVVTSRRACVSVVSSILSAVSLIVVLVVLLLCGFRSISGLVNPRVFSLYSWILGTSTLGAILSLLANLLDNLDEVTLPEVQGRLLLFSFSICLTSLLRTVLPDEHSLKFTPKGVAMSGFRE
ncbi:hypothetical protein Tco_0046894 [Tanacetum coccineum]